MKIVKTINNTKISIEIDDTKVIEFGELLQDIDLCEEVNSDEIINRPITLQSILNSSQRVELELEKILESESKFLFKNKQ